MKKLVINEMSDLTKEPYCYDIDTLTKWDWNDISKEDLSEQFADKYADNIRWDFYLRFNDFSNEIVFKHHHRFDRECWYEIQTHNNLSPEIIKAFWEKMGSGYLVEFQKVPAVVLNKMIKRKMISLHEVIELQPLNTDLVKRHYEEEYIDWYYIATKKKLTKKFIKTFQDELNFTAIAKHQKLSENMIEEFLNKWDWNMISEYQPLSLDFILKHCKLINLEKLKLNNDVNQEELINKGIYEFLKLTEEKANII